MKLKYGIKTVELSKFHPTFIEDCNNELVKWNTANDYVTGCIQTFIIQIAKIRHKNLECNCCVYPHETSADYTILIRVDDKYILLSMLKERNFYPKDGRRIEMLKKGLILFDTEQETLSTLYEAVKHSQDPF